MSYSYIKSVFPNFEPSTMNVNTLYNQIPEREKKTVNVKLQVAEANANGNDDYYKFAKSLINEASSVESFTNNMVSSSSHNDCDNHVNHILKCTRCREQILKHFNLEQDKMRNEEIMEIMSYIIFGIFILLLIEALRKN